MLKAFGFACGLLMVVPVSALAQALPDDSVLRGACAPGSFTVPPGSGPARSQPFACDTAIIIVTVPPIRRLMITFAQAGSTSPLLSLAGPLEPDGAIMVAERMYLGNDTPIEISDGACRLFHAAGRMSGIVCGATGSARSGPSAVLVEFHTAP